jgi:fluoroquinolone transport system ATP-binding protein
MTVPLITVKDLGYTYPHATAPALGGLSFEVARGEIFGFLGPSGAGKSTTQKILIGLLQDYQGHASVFDKSLREWGAAYYERIGVSFEYPNHYLKLSALENLDYFARLYEHPTLAAMPLLETVGLSGDAATPVGQFSKGMKNRLSVARALLNDPELVFMDEPTAGLDPVNARRIKDLVQAQARAGKTVFLTTHDMLIADELCDRVAFIVDGEIKLIDAPRALKLRYGTRRVRVEYLADGNTRAREFRLDGLGDEPEFIELLRHESLQTMHTLEATLEDIFIQVTGRSLDQAVE